MVSSLANLYLCIMPDDWEDKNGLDKYDPEDRNKDLQGNGYTALVNYLNSLVEVE